ncbi:hypothetical protein A3L23_03430 [Rhodococcoides fascians D188]|nr:hypothetical protein A3L23_03430 [Rhodococcus fascians D188]
MQEPGKANSPRRAWGGAHPEVCQGLTLEGTPLTRSIDRTLQ